MVCFTYCMIFDCMVLIVSDYFLIISDYFS